MNNMATEQLEGKHIFSLRLAIYDKMYRGSNSKNHPSSVCVLSKAMEEQFICLICLTCQGKQNGSVVSTNNQCTE